MGIKFFPALFAITWLIFIIVILDSLNCLRFIDGLGAYKNILLKGWIKKWFKSEFLRFGNECSPRFFLAWDLISD